MIKPGLVTLYHFIGGWVMYLVPYSSFISFVSGVIGTLSLASASAPLSTSWPPPGTLQLLLDGSCLTQVNTLWPSCTLPSIQIWLPKKEFQEGRCRNKYAFKKSQNILFLQGGDMKLSVNCVTFKPNWILPPKIAKTCTWMFWTTFMKKRCQKSNPQKTQEAKN